MCRTGWDMDTVVRGLAGSVCLDCPVATGGRDSLDKTWFDRLLGGIGSGVGSWVESATDQSKAT